jgi:hypothetical protein
MLSATSGRNRQESAEAGIECLVNPGRFRIPLSALLNQAGLFTEVQPLPCQYFCLECTPSSCVRYPKTVALISFEGISCERFHDRVTVILHSTRPASSRCGSILTTLILASAMKVSQVVVISHEPFTGQCSM